MNRLNLAAGRSATGAVAGAILLAAALAPLPARADIGLKFEPPTTGKLSCVKPDATPAMTRDWRNWHGEAVDVAPRDLLLVARAYADGTDSLDPDPAVARRMLETLVAGKSDATTDARKSLAKLTLTEATDKADSDAAVKQLEQAVAEHDVEAAVALGQYYEKGGPVPRDPAKALAYYRIGATVGDPGAVLGIARLAKAGAIAEMTPADADEAVRVAVLGLLTDVGKGNCDSLYRMGLLYQVGDLLPQDLALAARWYQTAADADHHAKAADNLARFYRDGTGVELSLPKMFTYLGIAANAGRSRSMLLLGEAYALGEGTTTDLPNAIHWFEKADARGEDASIRWLARIWRGDFGGTPDLAKAFAYLKRDSERPNPDRKTFFELGQAYLNGSGTDRNVEAGLASLNKAAQLGVKDAAALIGDVYRYGQGLPPDPLKAARYYRLAASFGNVGAMSALAEMHRCGIGVAMSPDQERTWRERAAFTGSGSSLYDYAVLLPAGGSADDQARRFRLFRQAAGLGSREAMVEVAVDYQNGIGIAADAAESKAWEARALAAGDDQARGYLALADAYERGAGVPRDMAKARALLQQIADAGDARGHYELARFLNTYGGASAEMIRTNLATAAAGGNSPAMRSLARQLGDSESAGGKDRQGWLLAAASAGDVRAKIALIGDSTAADSIESRLDKLVTGGICEPDQIADLALAYLALDTDSSAAKGKVWLDRAIARANGDPDVTYTLGRALSASTLGPELRQEGLTLLTQVADAGMVKAMRQLATGYSSNAWGKVDKDRSRMWLERAAAAGDASSAGDFAEMAAAAEPPDPAMLARAHDYLAKAAEVSPSAARQLGQLGMQGIFGDAGRNEAPHWLQVAANGGDASAMRNLADMLSTGGGGLERDPPQALEWLRKAAVAGDGKAMLTLGAAYEAGFGVAADQSAADQWYAAARRAGATPE